LSFGVGWEPPLGSNARMTVSQNAIRKRNRMRCLELPGRQWAQLRPTLAASAETLVFSARCFLSIFDANQPQFVYEFPTIRIG
jgi:hypothetical protein